MPPLQTHPSGERDTFSPRPTPLKQNVCIRHWTLNTLVGHADARIRVGLLWMECKALYTSGPRVYLLDSYNWIDFIVLSMYLSSYALRFLVDRRIKFADLQYNGTSRARDALVVKNFSQFYAVKDDIFSDCRHPTDSYFMKAC